MSRPSIRRMHQAGSRWPWWWPPIGATVSAGLLMLLAVNMSRYGRGSLRGTLDSPTEWLVLAVAVLMLAQYFLSQEWRRRQVSRLGPVEPLRRRLARPGWWALAAATAAAGSWAASWDLVRDGADPQTPLASPLVWRPLVAVWSIPVLAVLWRLWRPGLGPAEPDEVAHQGTLLALGQDEVEALTRATSDAALWSLTYGLRGGPGPWCLAIGERWAVVCRCLADRGLRRRTPAGGLLDGLNGRQLCDGDGDGGDGWVVRLTEPHKVPFVAVALNQVGMASMRRAFEALGGGDGGGSVLSRHEFQDIWRCFEEVRRFWSRAGEAGRAVVFVGR